MVYKLNDKEITKEKAENIIEDLATFPYNKDDYAISKEKRIENYRKALKKIKTLKVSCDLTLSIN